MDLSASFKRPNITAEPPDRDGWETGNFRSGPERRLRRGCRRKELVRSRRSAAYICSRAFGLPLGHCGPDHPHVDLDAWPNRYAHSARARFAAKAGIPTQRTRSLRPACKARPPLDLPFVDGLTQATRLIFGFGDLLMSRSPQRVFTCEMSPAALSFGMSCQATTVPPHWR